MIHLLLLRSERNTDGAYFLFSRVIIYSEGWGVIPFLTKQAG